MGCMRISCRFLRRCRRARRQAVSEPAAGLAGRSSLLGCKRLDKPHCCLACRALSILHRCAALQRRPLSVCNIAMGKALNHAARSLSGSSGLCCIARVLIRLTASKVAVGDAMCSFASSMPKSKGFCTTTAVPLRPLPSCATAEVQALKHTACGLSMLLGRHAPHILLVCIPNASEAVRGVGSTMAWSSSLSRHAAVLQGWLLGSSLGRHAAVLLSFLADCVPTVSKAVKDTVSAMPRHSILSRHAFVLLLRFWVQASACAVAGCMADGSSLCMRRHAAVLHRLFVCMPMMGKALKNTGGSWRLFRHAAVLLSGLPASIAIVGKARINAAWTLAGTSGLCRHAALLLRCCMGSACLAFLSRAPYGLARRMLHSRGWCIHTALLLSWLRACCCAVGWPLQDIIRNMAEKRGMCKHAALLLGRRNLASFTSCSMGRAGIHLQTICPVLLWGMLAKRQRMHWLALSPLQCRRQVQARHDLGR